jgi:hypothetical protein
VDGWLVFIAAYCFISKLYPFSVVYPPKVGWLDPRLGCGKVEMKLAMKLAQPAAARLARTFLAHPRAPGPSTAAFMVVTMDLLTTAVVLSQDA